MNNLKSCDQSISDLSARLAAAEAEAEEMREEINGLEDEVQFHCGVVGEIETERDLLKDELERIKGDRGGWAARSKEQFDRIGVALERVREHRESGEPSRDDATEIEALVEKVIHLEIESGHWIARSMDLEKEVERLTDMDELCTTSLAAEQERAMVVAFLMERNKNTSYAEAVRIATWQFAEMIKQGLHWSKG